jgi:hypothetical protein
MAGLGNISTISENELKKHFEKAKAEGADFLVIHGHSWTSGCLTMLMETIDFSERTIAVSKESTLEDLLKADVGEGLLNIKAVYDLTKDFNLLNNEQAKQSISLISEAAREAISDFEKRYYRREYNALPLSAKLFRFAPPRPKYLKP